ncbi:MAG: glycosyltransferase [Paludibacteraceae bacterium]|nr:glycosyltransferase [Paludibacteraceae bacterium]
MKTNQPLFSVLIANYNNGKYLMEAIESVRRQTYTNWEIILVDDASTDNSKELYKELEKDERIHIYLNEKNMGCGYTKRRCAELATGEICGFLDPDDALLPEALQVMVETHMNHAGAAIVSSRFEVCDEQMESLYVSRLLELKDGESYLEHRDYCPEHFVSYKKKCYDKTARIDANIPLGVDQDLYFRLEEQGSWIALDQVIYRYRAGAGISSVNKGVSAFFWNLLVRYNACLRRGLDPRLLPEKDFTDFILADALGFKAEGIEAGASKVRRSYAYRLGKFLLKPFRWMKGIIKYANKMKILA